MKANELMIDDWVYNKNIDKPMQVYPTMFSQMFRHRPDVTTEDYNIFPIPLTPEILEKNGWKHDPSMERLIIDCKLFIDRERWMSWDSKYHCLSITIRDSKQLSQYNLKELRLDVPCTNVHELQHALRLCGIEKEITL